MVGILGVLNMATRAMQVQQAGMEVTGNNISNADNTSYSRQRIVVNANAPVTSPVGPEGTGVKLVAIQQTRDSLLDAQVRDETSVGGYWTAVQTGLTNAQTELGEYLTSGSSGSTSSASDSSSMGLSGQLSGLFTAFDAVATDASSSNRQALVNTGATLANSFNQITTRLNTVRSNLNTSLTNDVAQANSLLSDIATLNGRILQTEAATGGTANDLRDEREAKLESLSNLLNVNVTTESNGTLTISNGASTLVSDSTVTDSLQANTDSNNDVQVSTVSGASLSLTGGSIQGELDTRDGALATLRTNINTLASTLISQVNGIYSNGYDLYGNTGANFFNGTDASDISINSSLLNDPALVQASGTAGASGDTSVALAISKLSTQTIGALNNQTFSDNYNQTVTTLGNSLSNATSEVSNHEAVNTMLSKQRDSASGVSLEEELTNMLNYQTAYSASSHVISTVNTMLQTLLTLGQ